MKLKKILELTVPGLGYELVDFTISPSNVITIFIDKENGVTIDDCEQVSRHISNLLIVEEINYNRLEVSSPGIERPLKTLQDFVRFLGKNVKIKTHNLINNEKNYQGIIQEVIDNNILLNIDNQIITIDTNNIAKARLIFNFKDNTKV